MSTNTNTRPEIPAEALEGLSPEEVAEFRAEFAQELETLEARGPLTFHFPTEGPLAGFMEVGGFREADDVPGGYVNFEETVNLTGAIELGTYQAVMDCELFHPSIEVLRDNPLADLGAVTVHGASDAHLMQLAQDQGWTVIRIFSVIGPEDVVAHAENLVADRAFYDNYVAENPDEEIPPYAVYGPAELAEGGDYITDAGLRAVAGMPKLNALRLHGTHITAEALAEVVPTLPKLEMLAIESDAISGADLAKLPVLPNLMSIQLSGPHITDGLDPEVLLSRVPDAQDLSINPGDASPEHGIRMALMFPGREINGVVMSERAARKAATKLGIEID